LALSRPNRLRDQAPKASAPPAAPLELGGGAFRFPGFGQDAVDLLLRRFDYRSAEPAPPAMLSDILFLPHLRCLYRADGARIEESKVTYIEPDAPPWFNTRKLEPIERQTMPERISPPASPERVRETVLYLGEPSDHYGHFVTDTLSRTWALANEDPEVKVLFAPDPGARFDPPFAGRILSWLGLDGSRILRPDGPTLFDRLICPIPALQLSRVYQAFDAPHRAAARRAMSAPGFPAPPDRPVYLTRRGLDGRMRKLAGEADLEHRLEREGYLIVEPERLGIDAQIALFNGDRPVVGTYGSAMHTVLFRTREEGQRLAVLFPPKIPPRFMMVDAVKGSRAAYLNCVTGTEAEGGGSLAIDCDAAMAQLDFSGFLSGR
jgi:hypothetical protein